MEVFTVSEKDFHLGLGGLIKGEPIPLGYRDKFWGRGIVGSPGGKFWVRENIFPQREFGGNLGDLSGGGVSHLGHFWGFKRLFLGFCESYLPHWGPPFFRGWPLLRGSSGADS